MKVKKTVKLTIGCIVFLTVVIIVSPLLGISHIAKRLADCTFDFVDWVKNNGE